MRGIYWRSQEKLIAAGSQGAVTHSNLLSSELDLLRVLKLK